MTVLRRRRSATAAVVSILILACSGAGPAAGSTTIPVTRAAAASSCPSGYTSATIDGIHKCLRAGEFCKHSDDYQYRKYGFRCVRYYANVRRYRLTHG